MGEVIVDGAKITCPFGTRASSLSVTSQTKVKINGKNVATIMDASPNVNFSTFDMCSSMINPAVQAATIAALGVLTPQKCTMMPAGTWSAVNPKLLADRKPCLCAGSTLVCAIGAGIITVANPGQRKVSAKSI